MVAIKYNNTSKLVGAGLTLFRGDRCLLENLDFTLQSGELLLVEGANGSGKTTLLRTVAGLSDPDEGRVCWNNTNVKEIRQAFHSNLVWMGHRPGYKGDLSLVENLRFEAGLRNMTMSTAEPQLQRLGVASLTGMPFRVLSAGQQRRAALARMILADATLWLMDEPFTNLDAAGNALVLEVLEAHLSEGGLCVMASHQNVVIDATVKRISL